MVPDFGIYFTYNLLFNKNSCFSAIYATFISWFFVAYWIY